MLGHFGQWNAFPAVGLPVGNLPTCTDVAGFLMHLTSHLNCNCRNLNICLIQLGESWDASMMNRFSKDPVLIAGVVVRKCFQARVYATFFWHDVLLHGCMVHNGEGSQLLQFNGSIRLRTAHVFPEVCSLVGSVQPRFRRHVWGFVLRYIQATYNMIYHHIQSYIYRYNMFSRLLFVNAKRTS